MSHGVTDLEKEFAHDHRHLTRGFSEIIRALQVNDWAEAQRLAAWLNQKGGPHIDFEERILYPEVAAARGQDYANNLYREHRVAISALEDLISLDPDARTEELKSSLIERLQVGLDHAVSCGTLLSHLTIHDVPTQEKMLEELRQARSNAEPMDQVITKRTI